MPVRIEKLVQGGNGFARLENGTNLFIQGALAGELVEYAVDQTKNGYINGHVNQVLEASEDRVVPPCPYYGICGGCDLQHLSSEKQAETKRTLVLENLGRIGAIDPTSLLVEEVSQGPFWAYRSRVRFHVELSSRSVGFLAKKTNTLIPLEHCPILVDSLNKVLAEKHQLVEAARKEMFSNNSGKTPYIEVNAFAGDTQLSFGEEPVLVTVDGHRYWVSAKVFFQGNRFLLSAMGQFVSQHCLGESVMDLYSGVGTFSSFLQEEGRHIVAVERDSRCLALAKKNVPSAEFFTDSVEAWGKGKKRFVDTVVVDPPRTGLDATVPDLISRWEPKRIIYVSCNSVTLARDLQKFLAQGYTPRVLKVFDLYPQTFHQEVAVVLDRKELRQ
ncbi:TRAM domain-containing protein [uncultured Sphaerochaeta sp.]|uniref:class I SAM-dependent RNA methyltransferase n=1 Tax=uncultured Sphaerochaeta sp. TaxID=886478 RepID=UPI002A0A0EC3|nr:TRAM domain-containing protein [uncultured Sphaerochaeta sp.]